MPDLLKDSRGSLVSPASPSELPSRIEIQPVSYPAVGLRRGLGAYAWQLIRASTPLICADVCSAMLGLIFGLIAVQAAGKIVNHFPPFVMGASLAYFLCFWASGLYPGLGKHPAEELRQHFRATLAATLTLVAIFLAMSNWQSPYVWMVMLAFPVQLLVRPFLRSSARSLMAAYGWTVPFYFVGDRDEIYRAYQDMFRLGWTGLEPVGRFVFSHDRERFEEFEDSNDSELSFERQVVYLGTSDRLRAEAQQNKVFWVFAIADTNDLSEPHTNQIGQFFPQVVWLQPRSSALASATTMVHCGLSSGVLVDEPLILPANRFAKRTVDILVSGTALLLLLPLLVIIALAIKLTSPGPVFFSQIRLSRNGKPFKFWKFRSMVCNATELLDQYLTLHPEYIEEWEKSHKLKNDPRITWIGKILRKTSLDEIPQLWNVLKGDMSLVGPRPIGEEEIVKYGPTLGDYLRVTPGLTGLWQISGRNNTPYHERLVFVEYYVRNWSPWLDVYILIRTVKTVALCEGAY